MDREQALTIIRNLANVCIKKGGIYESMQEATTVSMAINVLANVIEESKATTPNEGTSEI